MKVSYVSPIPKGQTQLNQNFDALHREIETRGGQIHHKEIPATSEVLVVRDYINYYNDISRSVHIIEKVEAEVKALLLADLHETGPITYENRIRWLRGFDVILSPYASHPLMNIYRAQLPETPIIPFPWWIDETLFRNNTGDRDYDITIIGKRNPYVYPLRDIMERELIGLTKEFNIKFVEMHPGYMDPKRGPGYYWGEKYADLLRESKILTFCSSIYQYPIFKYYEAAASGCLIIAPKPYWSIDTLRQLIYYPGVYRDALYLTWAFNDIPEDNLKYIKNHTAKKRAQELTSLCNKQT